MKLQSFIVVRALLFPFSSSSVRVTMWENFNYSLKNKHLYLAKTNTGRIWFLKWNALSKQDGKYFPWKERLKKTTSIKVILVLIQPKHPKMNILLHLKKTYITWCETYKITVSSETIERCSRNKAEYVTHSSW